MRVSPLFSALLLIGATTPACVEITAENAQSFYRDFPRLTNQPKEVSAWLSAQCASPEEAQQAQEAERSGPHAHSFVHLYFHGVEKAEFAKSERVFPVGAIVVKEKLGADGTPAAVGGMEKMEPGYDPKSGDWRYFFSSPASGFSSGRLENCRSCHSRAREADFVYFTTQGIR